MQRGVNTKAASSINPLPSNPSFLMANQAKARLSNLLVDRVAH
jgi:hypothetical protein